MYLENLFFCGDYTKYISNLKIRIQFFTSKLYIFFLFLISKEYITSILLFIIYYLSSFHHIHDYVFIVFPVSKCDYEQGVVGH